MSCHLTLLSHSFSGVWAEVELDVSVQSTIWTRTLLPSLLSAHALSPAFLPLSATNCSALTPVTCLVLLSMVGYSCDPPLLPHLALQITSTFSTCWLWGLPPAEPSLQLLETRVHISSLCERPTVISIGAGTTSFGPCPSSTQYVIAPQNPQEPQE